MLIAGGKHQAFACQGSASCQHTSHGYSRLHIVAGGNYICGLGQR